MLVMILGPPSLRQQILSTKHGAVDANHPEIANLKAQMMDPQQPPTTRPGPGLRNCAPPAAPGLECFVQGFSATSDLGIQGLDVEISVCRLPRPWRVTCEGVVLGRYMDKKASKGNIKRVQTSRSCCQASSFSDHARGNTKLAKHKCFKMRSQSFHPSQDLQ